MRAARLPLWTCGLLLVLAALPAIAQPTLSGAQGAALRLWRSDYPRHCLLLGGANAEAPDVARLERLVAYLEGETTLAAPLLDVARREAVPICLDDGCRGLFGYYDVTGSWIGVRSDLSFAEQALTLVHELRHLDQTVRGFGRSLDYAMAESARLTCAAEADVQAVTALFAWRLREAGDWDPWIALSASEHYADLAARFAAVAGAGASELAAASATFDRWYASAWRTGTYRRNACSDHLDLLDERHAIPSYAPLPDDYFEGFCVLPSGLAYDCAPPPCSAGRGGALGPAPR
jgi:hypothetical protein